MKHYKLREGESVRKPVVKRNLIEIRIPVLLLCLLSAFVVWLYIVSLSKIDPEKPLDTASVTEHASPDGEAAAEEPFETEGLLDMDVDREPVPASEPDGSAGA